MRFVVWLPAVFAFKEDLAREKEASLIAALGEQM